MSKGGTCPNKCCFETYRLSEDLDVTRTDPAHIDDAFLSRVFGDIDEWVDEHTGIELPDGGHRSSASASRLGGARARHTRRELLGPVGDIPGDAGGPHGRRQIEPQYWRIRIDGLLAPINPTTLAHCRRAARIGCDPHGVRDAKPEIPHCVGDFQIRDVVRWPLSPQVDREVPHPAGYSKRARPRVPQLIELDVARVTADAQLLECLGQRLSKAEPMIAHGEVDIQIGQGQPPQVDPRLPPAYIQRERERAPGGDQHGQPVRLAGRVSVPAKRRHHSDQPVAGGTQPDRRRGATRRVCRSVLLDQLVVVLGVLAIDLDLGTGRPGPNLESSIQQLDLYPRRRVGGCAAPRGGCGRLTRHGNRHGRGHGRRLAQLLGHRVGPQQGADAHDDQQHADRHGCHHAKEQDFLPAGHLRCRHACSPFTGLDEGNPDGVLCNLNCVLPAIVPHVDDTVPPPVTPHSSAPDDCTDGPRRDNETGRSRE
ncbi:MAG: hypothetical protein IH939_10575 [Acidobacteria bacterium]|nr:hypothetical protein [Acidobacteriota bacterium]